MNSTIGLPTHLIPPIHLIQVDLLEILGRRLLNGDPNPHLGAQLHLRIRILNAKESGLQW